VADNRDSDLLIVGAGSLGGRVGAVWREWHPDAEVLAETRSEQRHAQLKLTGMNTRLRDDEPPHAFSNLLFSMPASQPDYASECARAAALWNGAGNLVITSSTAVYAESEGNPCTETSALAENERAERLLACERIVLDANGVVVRLAGLYDESRGPHRVYLRKSESPRRPDGLVNLVHYDDAALLCALALEKGEPRAVYIGCDNAPIARSELVAAAVERAIAGGEEARACVFTATDGPLGRRCDSSWTRQVLGWSPHHASFTDWAAQI
jgi:nucleoside-diphosphate-sugar epimerase